LQVAIGPRAAVKPNINPVDPDDHNTSGGDSSDPSDSSKKTIIIITCIAVPLLVIAVIACIIIKRRKDRSMTFTSALTGGKRYLGDNGINTGH